MKTPLVKSIVAGVVLLIGAPFPRAQAAATWTPKHPADAALPATTTNGEFWPILLERLCTTKDGKPRDDRGGTCSDDKKTPGQLPSDPGNAMRKISTFLDDAVVHSVQVQSVQTQVIPLRKKSLDNLLSQIQPANDATPGSQGTPAQTEAVPSIQPVSQASANAAIAGTRAGTRVMASIALNPAGMLTTSTQDPSVQEAGTRDTRLGDLSLVVPVNPSGSMPGGGVLGSFDYVGVRLRVNATPLFQDALYPLAQKAVVEAMRQATVASSQTSDKIEPLLAGYDPSGCAASYVGAGTAPAAQCAQLAASDVLGRRLLAATACAEAIATASPDAIETACGQPLEVFDSARKAEAALHSALATLRDQHDATFIGLDARYEFGDPTFSMLPQARGSHLLAALAAGHRLLSGGNAAGRHSFVGIKARAGYQLTSLNNNMDRASSLDFAVGLETGVINNLQVFKLSVGAEGRHAWNNVPTNADTNFVDIKVGVDIPQSDGTRIGALLSLPAEGQHGATLSLVGNWSALTGALSSNP